MSGVSAIVGASTTTPSNTSGIASIPAIPSSSTSASVTMMRSPKSWSTFPFSPSLSLDASGTSGITPRPPAIGPAPSELSESELLPRLRDPAIPIGRGAAAAATAGMTVGGLYDDEGETEELVRRSAEADRSSDEDDPRLVLLPLASRTTSFESTRRIPVDVSRRYVAEGIPAEAMTAARDEAEE